MSVAAMLLEIEIQSGLKEIVLAELVRRFGKTAGIVPTEQEDSIRLHYERSPADLHALRTATAVYLLLHFNVPRPKALLGHEHLKRLTGQIDRVRGIHPSGAFNSFRFSAAGRESSVFDRLREAIADHTHMENEPDDADLFLRVRSSEIEPEGWDVLIRTTPRPLATRAWRRCDMLGALDGAVGAAMIELTGPQPGDRFFNPLCGSGTLLIERALAGPAGELSGCDLDWETLQCASENIDAAELDGQIDIFVMDAARLEMPDGRFNALCINPPWGQRSGSHDQNLTLYPALMKEMTRVAAPGARLALITHEITLFEALLDDLESSWNLREVVRVFQGGLHPRIYLLHRK